MNTKSGKVVEDIPLLTAGDIKGRDEKLTACTESLQYDKKKYMSMPRTSLYIFGEQVGAGSLALPHTLAAAGWGFFVLLVNLALMAAFSSVLYGKCWIIVRERYGLDDCSYVRNPSAYMGEKAFGVWFRRLVTVLNGISLLGGSTVLLLLAAQIAQALVDNNTPVRVSYCYWVLIIVGLLTPMSWLRSPKDFWFMAAIALVSISVALVIILVMSFLQIAEYDAHYDTRTSSYGLFLAIGTIFFAFCGATPTYPTIQQDMRDPAEFPTAAVIASAGMACFYGLISVVGFVAFGHDVRPSIVMSLPPGGVQIATQVIVIVHLAAATLLIVNPVFHSLEDIECFKVPHELSWRRVLIRTLVMLVIAFIGESIPNFSGLLALVGSSVIGLTAIVIPCAMYWRLCTTGESSKTPVNFPTSTRVLTIIVITMGVVGTVAATFSAVTELVTSSFIMPCYVNLTAASYPGSLS